MKGKNQNNILIGHSIAKLQFEVPEPPPPGFLSPFKTVQQWLIHICDTNQEPEHPISEYLIGLSNSPGDYELFLAGYNRYVFDEEITIYRIDFKPVTHMFFALPKEEYGHLFKQNVQELILNELKQFIRSAKFQDSFLSKGQSIMTNFKGEIWSR